MAKRTHIHNGVAKPGVETYRLKDSKRKKTQSGEKPRDNKDALAKHEIVVRLRENLAKYGATPDEIESHVRRYRALYRDLPSDSVSVRDIVALRVEFTYLSLSRAAAAKLAGETTIAGRKLIEASNSAAMMAQRATLTSHGIADQASEGGGGQQRELACLVDEGLAPAIILPPERPRPVIAASTDSVTAAPEEASSEALPEVAPKPPLQERAILTHHSELAESNGAAAKPMAGQAISAALGLTVQEMLRGRH